SFAGVTILRTLHVGMDRRIMKHGMNWIIFYLIHDDRLIDKGSQQFDLCRRMVADSEAAYLSRPMQEIEGLRDFLRFDQRVGTMQQQDVQVARLQPLQTSVDTLNNMVKAQVEACRQSFLRLVAQIDAALALKDDFVSQVCILFQEFAKNGF